MPAAFCERAGGLVPGLPTWGGGGADVGLDAGEELVAVALEAVLPGGDAEGGGRIGVVEAVAHVVTALFGTSERKSANMRC